MIKSARELYNLQRGSRTDWFRIVNRGDSAPVAVHIYDHIGLLGVTAQDFVKDLLEIKGPLELHLNSEGGEVFEGIAIYNALSQRKGVSVVVDSLAASIASVIAMAADPGELSMGPNSEMMIHDAFGIVGGNSDEVRKLADQLDKESNRIARIYAERTGMTEAHWRQVMRDEHWYDQDEAVSAGLADRVMTRTRNSVQDAASRPWVSETQARHIPMTTGPHGHVHDHAAYEASDHDDGMHMHPHVHENDANHHHDHSAVPDGVHAEAGSPWMMAANIVAKIMDVDPSSILGWDAASAMGKCKSASDYRSICAGERSSGDPDSQGHWALPHHSSPGAEPDRGGVISALGRWNQTQGLKNKDAALSHLKAHASSLGLPSGGKGGEDSLPTGMFDDDDAANLIRALRS